jgi:hypothetical protein
MPGRRSGQGFLAFNGRQPPIFLNFGKFQKFDLRIHNFTEKQAAFMDLIQTAEKRETPQHIIGLVADALSAAYTHPQP